MQRDEAASQPGERIAALEGEVQRLRALVEATSDWLWEVDRQGIYTYASPKVTELLGYTPEEVIGRTPFDFMPQEEAARVSAFFADIVASHKPIVQMINTNLHKDGRRVVLETSGMPILDAHGDLLGYRGIDRDVTDRFLAEERIRQLLRSVERWAAEMDATIAAIADGVIIYDPGGTIRRLNHAVERLFGYTPELEALPFAERLMHLHVQTTDGRTLTYNEQPPCRALRGETIQGMVLSFTRSDGQQRWISVSAAPIPSPEGEILGAVATLSDITPLRELQQRQEELLHIVSHDLRTPLTVIHGHMELLEAGLRQRHLADELFLSTSTIDRNVRRMNLMIQDLVDMARLEGRQFHLTLEDVILQTYLPDLLVRLREILPVHRVALEIPLDLPPVRADFSRLERILLNLLTNAFKYSAADTPVHIRASRQDTEIVIAVSDQGRGVAPKDLPHLFERFYRAAGERKAEGIGLGLYITKLLVEAHGGRIWAESEPGAGSTFTVTLPMA